MIMTQPDGTVRLLSCGAGPDVPIAAPLTVFGRHPDCDIRLNTSDVSRLHCAVLSAEGRLTIRDLGSRNGTLVNGRRVHQQDLLPGDELRIGSFRYRVIHRLELDRLDAPLDASQVGRRP